jgi:glucose-1-phosphate cytidylyltransferase
MNNDFHLNKDGEIHFYNRPEEWNIIFADTGLETMTGGRIGRIQKYIDEDEFMLTYGDGVARYLWINCLPFTIKRGKLPQ